MDEFAGVIVAGRHASILSSYTNVIVHYRAGNLEEYVLRPLGQYE
jgi:hypothetical protein